MTEKRISFDNTEVAFAGKSDKEISKAKGLFELFNKTWLVGLLQAGGMLAIKLGIPVAPFVRGNIFAHFCGGETLDESLPSIKALGDYKISTILDHAVEGNETEEDFDKAAKEIGHAIDFGSRTESVPVVSLKVTGLARFELLEKLDAKSELTEKEKKEWKAVQNRMDMLGLLCYQKGVRLYIDAEESWIQDTIDELTDDLMERYNSERHVVFNTFQLYRHDRLEFLKKSYERAREKNYLLGAKLVRGAYMEKERERAKDNGYESPIQPDKESTDRDFDAAAVFCIEHRDNINVCIASHNEHSCSSLAEKMLHEGISTDMANVNFAQLYGMSDHITFNLASAGFNAGKYLPYGPIQKVMPYLIRRAEENTAIDDQMGRELQLINKEIKRRKNV